jgi:hypothetical protein
MDITCAAAGAKELYDVQLSSTCSDAFVQQRYCHMCMGIAGCWDWVGNRALQVSELQTFQLLESQTRVDSDAVDRASDPAVLLPILGFRRLASSMFSSHASGDQHELHRVADNPATSMIKVTGYVRCLHQAPPLPVSPQADSGLASGGVSMLPTKPRVTNYAAGSSLNVTVQMLDAYQRLVNTDVLSATRPGASLQRVTIRATAQDVFLSGAEAQAFASGIASLTGLSLVAEPGAYELLLESPGLKSAAIEVVVRDCVAGEVFSGNRCIVCSNGTFALHMRPADASCRACPDQAVCYGSTAFVPVLGSYHASLLSLNFYRYAGLPLTAC